MSTLAIPTLHRLIARGDYVALEKGHLVIKPVSGKPIPSDWLANHRLEMLQQVAEITGQPIFQYLDYSTGRYSHRLSPGVLLNYVNLQSGQTSPIFFNAELTRERTTKAGKKGADLPKGQFRVNHGYAFVKYWEKLGLELPRRLSEFHYAMGKLKVILITACIDEKGRIDKSSIMANISYEQLRQAIVGAPSVTGKSLASNWQAAGNLLAKTTGKEIAETQTQQGFQANLSTCAKQYDLSKQGSASKATQVDNLSIGNTPINQSVDDWLNDYLSTPGRFPH